jgi:hypothetical protein
MTFAAMHGRLQLCQWLRAQQCPWSTSAVIVAAINNHCELLRWLIESGCPYDAHKVCTSAAYQLNSSGFSTLQYLCEQSILTGPQLLRDTLNVAGSRDNLAVVKLLRQRGAEWPAVLRYSVVPGATAWRGEVLAWA